MNKKITAGEFHDSVERQLSGLKPDPRLAQRIIASGKGEEKVVKKTSISLVILAALVIISVSAALAAGLGLFGTVDLANTERHDGLLGFCELPDERLVFAGYTEMPDAPEKSAGLILCLNPDRTECWTCTDREVSGYRSVVETKDHTLAVCSLSSVKFYDLDGNPAGKEILLSALNAETVEITSFGILSADGGYTQLTGWDGDVLFRIDVPETMWAGNALIEAEDGLLFCGAEAAGPSETRVKIMKVDLQGNTVWETVLPSLSDTWDSTGLGNGIRTDDGGYLAVLWELETVPGQEETEIRRALVRFDSAGQLLWMRQSDFAFWQLAEYDGKFMGYEMALDPETGREYMRYLWLDTDGNELGTTELRLRDEDLPRYVDSGNMSMTVEKLFPMRDGLWQVVCFWETDEPEEDEPTWTQQDNALIKVPEL